MSKLLSKKKKKKKPTRNREKCKRCPEHDGWMDGRTDGWMIGCMELHFCQYIK